MNHSDTSVKPLQDDVKLQMIKKQINLLMKMHFLVLESILQFLESKILN